MTKEFTAAEMALLQHIDMWELFKEAVETARSLPSTPRVTFPRKSAMPEAPDEISPFAIMRAFKDGDILHMPETAPPRLGRTREQIATHDEVMGLWHNYAFKGRGRWREYRRIVWAYAEGIPPRRLRAKYGVHRQRLHVLKFQAMADMNAALLKAHRKNVDVLGVWG